MRCFPLLFLVILMQKMAGAFARNVRPGSNLPHFFYYVGMFLLDFILLYINCLILLFNCLCSSSDFILVSSILTQNLYCQRLFDMFPHCQAFCFLSSFDIVFFFTKLTSAVVQSTIFRHVLCAMKSV